MKFKITPSKVSQDFVNSGYGVSLKGFLNRDEFMRTLAKSLQQSTLIGFATFAALTILGDFESWYIGPYKMALATLATIAAANIRARKIGEKYLDEGDPLKEAR